MNLAHSDGLLSIGEVLAGLRDDFPDVTVSKIRFLESEQLVAPTRTQGGYRKFTPADVERLRYILTAQRDRFLPLRVIREELDAIDRGLLPQPDSRAVGVPRSLVLAADPDDEAVPLLRLTREDLLRESSIDEPLLRTLEQYAMVRAGDDGFYDLHSLRVCHCAAELTGFGVEPRHLRQSKVAADREVGIIAAAVGPYLRKSAPGSASRAHDMSREMSALFLCLHAALLQSGVGDELGM